MSMRAKLAGALGMLAVSLLLLAGISALTDLLNPVRVPVLMLHSVTREPEGEWSITAEKLREDITLLQAQGYEIVSLQQVIDYGEGKGNLPERPVCLTFDDGYHDNYTELLPLVEELQVPVTVFVIGCTVDSDKVNDAGQRVWLSTEELNALAASPWVTVQTHTWNLHRETTDADSGRTRTYILPLEGETEAHYRAVLTEDFQQEQALLTGSGVSELCAMAYPHGDGCSLTEEILGELGIRLTLTTDYSAGNLVYRGRADSLYNLGRMNLNNDTTAEQLLAYLQRPTQREAIWHLCLRRLGLLS